MRTNLNPDLNVTLCVFYELKDRNMTDPREKPLTDAAILATGDYNPHFANPRERAIAETRLFLARWDALQSWQLEDDCAVLVGGASIRMILFCPSCGVQHIDAPEPHLEDCQLDPCDCGAWRNPPHKSHLCHYCQHVWRPADVPTIGVKEIETVGERDTPDPVRRVIDKTARFYYRRDDCVFRYCPTVGLCQRDDKCRHPAEGA